MKTKDEALKMAIEAFDWEKVNKKCKVDILTMVMDFSNERIDASELMERIASRCQATLELAYKQACKEALAQPAQEPVGCIEVVSNPPRHTTTAGNFFKRIKLFKDINDLPVCNLYTHPALVTQEPVAWIDEEKKIIYWHNTHEIDDLHGFTRTTAVYKRPAPSWQGLSDDDMSIIFDKFDWKEVEIAGEYLDLFKFARAIEQALKEKNT